MNELACVRIGSVMIVIWPELCYNGRQERIEMDTEITYLLNQAGGGLPKTDTGWMLECNVDDCGGEAMGYVMELLFAQGAKDAWFSPIFMKKNRPAYTLHVICGEEEREELEHIIFSGTTTIGIRRARMERTVLNRSFMEVETSLGTGTVKLCRHQNRIYAYPEFESVKLICQSSGQDYQTVYHLMKEAAMRRIEEEIKYPADAI